MSVSSLFWFDTGLGRVYRPRLRRRLGENAVERCLGLLKEARQGGHVKNPGGLLTTFLKKTAAASGVAL